MNDHQASDELAAHVKLSEGLRLVPYVDAAGYTTWGYGHKHRAGEPIPPSITVDQADAILSGDLSIAGNAVRRLVAVEMTQAQYDGLTDFTFNLGEAAFAASTMLSLINMGEWDQACTECEKWDHAHVAGQLVELAGLKVRRAWDAAHMNPASVDEEAAINATVVHVESILPPDQPTPQQIEQAAANDTAATAAPAPAFTEREMLDADPSGELANAPLAPPAETPAPAPAAS